MITFRTTSGEVNQPQGYAPNGSVSKKGNRGSKADANAETAEK